MQSTEQGESAVIQCDRAAAALALGQADHRAAVAFLDLAADRQRAGGEVDIGPAQPDHLAAT
jgi:hypothetical protein